MVNVYSRLTKIDGNALFNFQFNFYNFYRETKNYFLTVTIREGV